jgi:hypothetical protein
MNERIKQLAEQAGFVLWQDESWNPGDVIDWSLRYDDEFKKFAELIVDECCLKLLDMDEKTNGRHNYYKHAALELKRHVGVKE